jgi:MipA family protein
VIKASLTCLLLMTPCAPLIAQPAPDAAPPREADQYSLTLGIGGGISPAYDGARDYKFQPGGLIRGQIDGFEFIARGTNLYVDLIREDARAPINLIAGPVVQLRLERTGTIDDPRVALFGKRKAALEVGGYVGIGKRGITNPYDSLTFDISYVRDVSGIHKSYIITPGVAFLTPVSRRTIARLGVSADYVGKGYGRTYFDVPAIAAPIPTLRGYSTKGSGFKSAGATLLVVQGLGKDPRKGWALFGLAGYSQLLGQYKNSPIVADAGRAGQFLGVAGVAYSF